MPFRQRVDQTERAKIFSGLEKFLALLSFEWVNSVNQWRQIHVLLGKKKA
jgi:hypothetical protein